MSDAPFQFDSNNAAYLEALLDQFHRDAAQVPAPWREFFRYLSDSHGNGNGRPKPVPSFRPTSVFNPPPLAPSDQHLHSARLQDRVDQLVRSYRVRGHLVARLDPLGFLRSEPAELSPQTYRLSGDDMDRAVSTTSIGGPSTQTVREIIDRLQRTYCRHIGAQFMHIDEPEVRNWLAQRMEQSQNRLTISRQQQLRILTRLTDAVIFEQFVRKKYVGAKTFSLEGSESLIPLLDLAIEKAAMQGVDEIVMGMAHRGRLNVLANIIGKTPREIFWEFEEPNPERHRGRGDVKYHMGLSGDWTTTDGRNVHLSLCFNPSHLEFVNPVALGRTRDKQDRAAWRAVRDHQSSDRYEVPDSARRRGMALLIHGDAGFAGEGIVQESLNLGGLPDYHVGGTLHVVVNNQLGFTTPPAQGRSTVYATDVARMLQVPVFHVNGEYPEAVAQVVDLAMDFRQTFGRDVVIDMYCFRRWGHNEGDEPSFTQPVLYNAIEHRPSVRTSYLDHLLELEGMTRDEADEIADERYGFLQQEFKLAQKQQRMPLPESLSGLWEGYQGGEEPDDDRPQTGVAAGRLRDLLARLTQTPEDFHLHRKLKRSVDRRTKMAEGRQPLDWSSAEALALASLAVEGCRVRMTGQDSARGTFSQRHAVLHDVVDGHTHKIFAHLADDQAPVEIINSPLCEAGDLGFQYGYSLDSPDALVIWEAQYGDFCNAAQVIIDQFLVSAEDKWRRLSGLVLLLPHGFEGQGPEHSSARLERFLMLAAEHNIQIAIPSTPAQYFHLLRRQAKRRWRKPLIVLTPKSLLRHRRCVSDIQELAGGGFQRVIADRDTSPEHSNSRGGTTGSATRVLLCSGKISYELLAAREERKRDDVAVIRVEQLYPFPETELRQALDDYADGLPVFWVQEEPENMGAGFDWKVRFCDRLFDRFPFAVIARPESASPATGSSDAHRREQKELIHRAFGDADDDSTSHRENPS